MAEVVAEMTMSVDGFTNVFGGIMTCKKHCYNGTEEETSLKTSDSRFKI